MTTLEKMRELRVGEEVTQGKWGTAKLTVYRKATDVDVEFADGTKREHVSYDSFRRGLVAKIGQRTGAERYLGVRKMMNCGMYGELVAYDSGTNVTIRFEDGTERHCEIGRFVNGTATPITDYTYAGFKLRIKPVMVLGEQVYFKCTCRKCGYTVVSRLLDLHKHVCNEEQEG